SKLQIAKMYVKHLQKLDKTSLALDFIKEEELISNNDFQIWFHSDFLQSGVSKNKRVLKFSLPDTNLNLSPVHGLSRHDSHFISSSHDNLFTFETDSEVYRMNLYLHFVTIDIHYCK